MEAGWSRESTRLHGREHRSRMNRLTLPSTAMSDFSNTLPEPGTVRKVDRVNLRYDKSHGPCASANGSRATARPQRISHGTVMVGRIQLVLVETVLPLCDGTSHRNFPCIHCGSPYNPRCKSDLTPRFPQIHRPRSRCRRFTCCREGAPASENRSTAVRLGGQKYR